MEWSWNNYKTWTRVPPFEKNDTQSITAFSAALTHHSRSWRVEQVLQMMQKGKQEVKVACFDDWSTNNQLKHCHHVVCFSACMDTNIITSSFVFLEDASPWIWIYSKSLFLLDLRERNVSNEKRKRWNEDQIYPVTVIEKEWEIMIKKLTSWWESNEKVYSSNINSRTKGSLKAAIRRARWESFKSLLLYAQHFTCKGWGVSTISHIILIFNIPHLKYEVYTWRRRKRKQWHIHKHIQTEWTIEQAGRLRSQSEGRESWKSERAQQQQSHPSDLICCVWSVDWRSRKELYHEAGMILVTTSKSSNRILLELKPIMITSPLSLPLCSWLPHHPFVIDPNHRSHYHNLRSWMKPFIQFARWITMSKPKIKDGAMMTLVVFSLFEHCIAAAICDFRSRIMARINGSSYMHTPLP